MKQFYSRVLTTQDSDIEKWRDLTSSNPQTDIYFTPEFVMTFEGSTGTTRRDFGGEALLFFYGNQQDYIIYPFFKRPINELPFSELLPMESKIWYDIISPYGYSGPLPYITNPHLEYRLWEGFIEELHSYCNVNHIVAEFVRLHPYIKNHLPLQKFSGIIDLKQRSNVVYIDLEQDESLIWKNMTKGHKSSVSKARRSGVEISSKTTKEQLDAFHQLYISTMERNKATGAYFFNREFFTENFRLLNDKIKIFSVCYKGQTIAASIFLFTNNLAHYYLSGSDANFLSVCPNNLLLWEVILWAKAHNYKLFNLGGGYASDDNLYHFKSSFSKASACFYTYSRVHNETAYSELCKAREQHAILNNQAIAQFDYFPAYRR